ncbi:hypothetical protein Dsin_017699 [Dipteronia sinensis]|uniref:Mitogen-activated protein kinase kinase kinase 1 n=1 Tax=Dipteronia sinensis TaxID=43782 RepID=A0AAE0E858_9ROSI|nr:hypothetical protein Dsin_017699 [Dipteronia sinensis]
MRLQNHVVTQHMFSFFPEKTNMESVASNETPQDHRPRFRHNQPVADRIGRALRHHLRLLHRTADSIFFMLGVTGNVYTVTLSSSPSCTCPDRITPCKHILFVYIRVLGVSMYDTCLRKRNLSPYHLNRLLNKPTLVNSLAGAGLRERFHELFFQQQRNNNNSNCDDNNGGGGGVEKRVEDGSTCPICLDDGGKGSVVSCGTCRNWIHEECYMMWKRSGRRRTSCVICRAKWRTATVQDKYLNLGPYLHQEDHHHDHVLQTDHHNNGDEGLCGG